MPKRITEKQRTKMVVAAIPGRPVPKGRPRLGRHGVYTPETTSSAESILQVYFKQACPVPLQGPLELVVSFQFRRPDHWSKANRDAVDEGQEPWRTGKPDLDNLVKLVKDAGNGILWDDDAQVVKIDAVKVYASEDQTVVNVITLELRKEKLLMSKVYKRADIEAKATKFIHSASTPPGAKGVKAVSAKQLDKLVTRVTQESIQAIELGGGRVEG